MAFLKKIPNLKERPRFGSRQIRTIRGLHVGQKVIEFCEGYGAWALIEVIELFDKLENGFYITVSEIDFNGYYKNQKSIFLSDHNVMPEDFKPITWNPFRCLIRTKAKTARGLERTKEKSLIDKRKN